MSGPFKKGGAPTYFVQGSVDPWVPAVHSESAFQKLRSLGIPTEYALVPGMLTELARTGISLAFALEHMFNIAPEWGVFLRVRKDAARAPGPQRPLRSFSFAGARGKRFPIELSSRQLSPVDPSGDGLFKRVRRWVRTRTTKG